MKKHSKKEHKSHHIFAYLGALLLIFVIFLGVKYFEAEYSFENILFDDNNQAYDNGKLTENPFILKDEILKVDTTQWRVFGSEKLTFAYPREYALRIMKGDYIKIIPPVLNNKTKENCDSYTDEQEYSQCLYPNISPDITIELKNDSEVNPFNSSDNIKKININGDTWQKKLYQDEYGGQVWYRHKIDSGILVVSYKYADSFGGYSFESIHDSRGNQYQLSAIDQNKLVMNIITTIEIK